MKTEHKRIKLTGSAEEDANAIVNALDEVSHTGGWNMPLTDYAVYLRHLVMALTERVELVEDELG